MTEEKKSRRGRVPFGERLAAVDAQVQRHRDAIRRLESKRAAMVEEQRKVVDAMASELPPVAMASRGMSPVEVEA